jgi:hypothetical protein
VRHWKCLDAQVVVFDDSTRFDHNAPSIELGPSIWPDDFGQQTSHNQERRSTAIHGNLAAGFEQRQRGDQTTEAEQVVEMGMGEQDAIEPTEPESALEQLALGALTTVHQEPAVPVQHHQRWQPSVDGRDTRGSAKENDFEQVPLTSRPACLVSS